VTATRFGILVGAILALTWVVLGFWAFLGVAVAMAIGALIGRVIDGKLDLASMVAVIRGKRTSS
jgi:hypothetical protein